MAERRKRVKIPTEFEAAAFAGRGTVKNVSTGGLYVATTEIPEQGETVRLSLTPAGLGRLDLTGMVWWTSRDTPHGRQGPGFGLRLLDECEDFDRLVDSLG